MDKRGLHFKRIHQIANTDGQRFRDKLMRAKQITKPYAGWQRRIVSSGLQTASDGDVGLAITFGFES
ncbi:hypothetical protein [uncultured Tateyamaria sp.]|uniref:hypothetical protein n=1 Tax=uncultured Tateyamaria sp. TaxID=455651 RepID=UPI00261DEE87|nr:hypothetical protein [uncultured Tateyamaria sp.]